MAVPNVLQTLLIVVCVSAGRILGQSRQVRLGETTLEIGDDFIFVHRPSLNENAPMARIGEGLPSPRDAVISRPSDDEILISWPNSAQRLRIKQEKDVPCELFETYGDTDTNYIQDCHRLYSSNWYGIGETYPQAWPLSTATFVDQPFVTAEVGKIDGRFVGNIADRYLLSSDGRAVKVDDDAPLFLTLSPPTDNLCLAVRRSEPFAVPATEEMRLSYNICYGHNLREVHTFIQDTYLPKPSGIPADAMFRYPIWSTWAEYFQDIDQTKSLEFAHTIKDKGFNNVLFEVDDRWETCYGSFQFHETKFPDPASMFNEIHSLGFNVSLWTHPFVNQDCSVFEEGAAAGYLLKDGDNPALTTWWDGTAGVVDMTYDAASAWWVNRIKGMKEQYGLDGLKFDSGETSYLPPSYQMPHAQPQLVPNAFTSQYVAAVASVTNYAEVRSGYKSQQNPVFVRIQDRSSVWDGPMGMQSVIPALLSIGLAGYPFVLPDMIGGNGVADRELMIRWIELNALLPVMQFSVSPWHYDDEVTSLALRMVDLHSQYAQYIVDVAQNATLTGDPIIRPVWWVDPTDVATQTIADQFLVGNDILVAPVVQPSATSRSVYIPTGSWDDKLYGGTIQGPQLLEGYTVPLDQLAYFVRSAAAV